MHLCALIFTQVTACITAASFCAANMGLRMSCTALLLLGYNMMLLCAMFYTSRTVRMVALYTIQLEHASYKGILEQISDTDTDTPDEGKALPVVTMRASRILAWVNDVKLFVASTFVAIVIAVFLDLPYFLHGEFSSMFIPSSSFVSEPCEELGPSVSYFTYFIGALLLPLQKVSARYFLPYQLRTLGNEVPRNSLIVCQPLPIVFFFFRKLINKIHFRRLISRQFFYDSLPIYFKNRVFNHVQIFIRCFFLYSHMFSGTYMSPTYCRQKPD